MGKASFGSGRISEGLKPQCMTTPDRTADSTRYSASSSPSATSGWKAMTSCSVSLPGARVGKAATYDRATPSNSCSTDSISWLK